MATVKHIEDHFAETVEPRILEQYKDSERWKACLKAVIDQMQIAEDASFELAHILDMETEQPTGKRLDWLASLLNIKRMYGESDADFFARFKSDLQKNNAGTPDNVIYAAAMISGDAHPQYLDEAPATFFVYTGPRPDGDGGIAQGGSQLTRQQVKKMAPAGVLGLPGAAINADAGSAGNESFLADYDGKIFLMAADDSAIS